MCNLYNIGSENGLCYNGSIQKGGVSQHEEDHCAATDSDVGFQLVCGFSGGRGSGGGGRGCGLLQPHLR